MYDFNAAKQKSTQIDECLTNTYQTLSLMIMFGMLIIAVLDFKRK
ncbi:putative holin-like toxin [Thermoanaerobacterium saccharolyticum]